MWNLEYTELARKDFNNLDGSVKPIVLKAILKVLQNPLPAAQGGYGKPLGNKGGINLTNLFKIKLRQHGIRIVYKLVKDGTKNTMKIIVISVRSDNEVYTTASKRENL